MGGLYGGYGNRVAKVVVEKPFMDTVVSALVAGFQARGVQANGVSDRAYQPGAAVPTPLVLPGALKSFSTESRYTMQAHVEAIVRLHAADGRVLVEKDISEKDSESAKGDLDYKGSRHPRVRSAR